MGFANGFVPFKLSKNENMLSKLFGWGKKKGTDDQTPEPTFSFGRYSDNNKTILQVDRWTDAENNFKEKKVYESIDAFFSYLRDTSTDNVIYERNANEGRFELFQGSKKVKGFFNDKKLEAEVTLARMPQPSVPVMRRLLEMNFNLYYSRFALDSDRLCMRFDSSIETASPSKLYYGLKELATRADKQDDLLTQDFSVLEVTDTEHVDEIAIAEKEIKYEHLQKWIQETLDTIATVDADKFSGGIAYLLLTLVYRIDFLISPEGSLLNDLEKISGIFFKKDDRQPVEKNRDMIEEFKKVQAKTKEEVFKNLFRSKYTFAIVAPQPHKTIADSINGSNQNMYWYRDNNYPYFANQIIEYGISFSQYSYSMPKVITELFLLYMRINYPDYFIALGFNTIYYDAGRKVFNANLVIEKIKSIQEQWRTRYPKMDFKVNNLRFDSLLNFNHSFSTEIEFLNMDSK